MCVCEGVLSIMRNFQRIGKWRKLCTEHLDLTIANLLSNLIFLSILNSEVNLKRLEGIVTFHP